MKVLIAIYYHPEAYPPTLNAIGELRKIAEKISILYRPHLPDVWKYPKNVQLMPAGKAMSSRAQEQSSLWIKILLFAQFLNILAKTLFKEKPDIILLYDAIPLLAYRLVRFVFRKKILVWYHNHDVSESTGMRKYAIGWWAAFLESSAFRWIDLFTLPSKERAAYFPLASYKGAYFFLPNLPALRFYNTFQQVEKPQDELRLVYQGSINAEHGLEELLAVLPIPISGKKLKLHILGKASDDYRKSFLEKAATYKVQDQVIFEGYISYSKLPLYTSSNHIGIGINKPQGIIYQTGGTASNKIYEYMACGLPVLYYDIPHYREHLQQYPWTFATDLSRTSLLECLSTIANSYAEISATAKKDFQETLNYEQHFEPILAYLNMKRTESE